MIKLNLAAEKGLHIVFEVTDAVCLEVIHLSQNGVRYDIRSTLNHLDLRLRKFSGTFLNLVS